MSNSNTLKHFATTLLKAARSYSRERHISVWEDDVERVGLVIYPNSETRERCGEADIAAMSNIGGGWVLLDATQVEPLACGHMTCLLNPGQVLTLLTYSYQGDTAPTLPGV